MVSPDGPPPADHLKAVPVVQGAEVVLYEPVDESFGVPAETAQIVAEQILGALATHDIDPDTVVFNGYYDAGDCHAEQTEGKPNVPLPGVSLTEEIELMKRVLPGLPEDPTELNYILATLTRRMQLLPDKQRRPYFFNSADKLADGEAGPLAFAATGPNPAVGVYDLLALRAYGYSPLLQTVTATPREVEKALVLEFRPSYRRTDPEA